jgi:hypothetical protein
MKGKWSDKFRNLFGSRFYYKETIIYNDKKVSPNSEEGKKVMRASKKMYEAFEKMNEAFKEIFK